MKEHAIIVDCIVCQCQVQVCNWSMKDVPAGPCKKNGEKVVQTNLICGTLNQRQSLHMHFKWCTQAQFGFCYIGQCKNFKLYTVLVQNGWNIIYTTTGHFEWILSNWVIPSNSQPMSVKLELYLFLFCPLFLYIYNTYCHYIVLYLQHVVHIHLLLIQSKWLSISLILFFPYTTWLLNVCLLIIYKQLFTMISYKDITYRHVSRETTGTWTFTITWWV